VRVNGAKGGLPPHVLVFLVTGLATTLLVFLGTLAYGRLESLASVGQRETQMALDSLGQRVEEAGERTAVALEELEALKQEQEAVRSRLQALEAGRPEVSTLRSDVADLAHRLDDLTSSGRGLQRAEIEGDGPAVATPSRDQPVAEPGAPAPAGTVEDVLLGVPLYQQSHNLSCEATVASMVAAFFGVSLSEEEAVASLPLNENPQLGFRCDVDGPPGGLDDYGVYAGPIKQLLTRHGLQTSDVEGGLEGVRSALAAGHPVIAWITYHLWQETPVELTLTGGETVTLVPYEHTVALVGYTADGLWALDPYDGERQVLPWSDFERSWDYLGQMALEVSSP
jgi:uncharacterized protein YvpB